MSKIEEKANSVANRMVTYSATPQSVAFDPLTILVIIQALSAILKLFNDCNLSANKAKRTASRPGPVMRRLMENIVRDKIREHVTQDRNEIRELEDTISYEMQLDAKTYTEEDMVEMLAEVQ
jgi:hypothetical protein